MLDDSRRRTGHRHEDYAPAPRATAARHAIYSANLVLLILAVAGPVTGSRLFPGARDPAGRWRGTVLLWRSALGEQDWTDLALALNLRRTWAGSPRDLEISLAGATPRPPEPVDLYWHFWYPPDHPKRGRLAVAPQLLGRAGSQAGPLGRHQRLDDPARHGARIPLAGTRPHDVPQRRRRPGHLGRPRPDRAEPAAGAGARDEERGARDELAALYRRLESVFDPPPTWDAEHRDRAITLTLQHLRADAARLPALDVARYLRATLTEGSRGREILALVPDIAAAVLPGLDDRAELPGLRALLEAIAAFARQAVADLDAAGCPPTAAPGRDRQRRGSSRSSGSEYPFPSGLWPDDPRLLRAVTYRARPAQRGRRPGQLPAAPGGTRRAGRAPACS